LAKILSILMDSSDFAIRVSVEILYLVGNIPHFPFDLDHTVYLEKYRIVRYPSKFKNINSSSMAERPHKPPMHRDVKNKQKLFLQ